ncbi:MAG: polyprenyl synthetase family protein [Pseudomonadota bacterium]
MGQSVWKKSTLNKLNTRSLEIALTETADAVAGLLDRLLTTSDGPENRLCDAMRYAVLNGGKRFRPFLAMTSADLFDVPRPRALRVAAAVELVHSYSLVHDDLPAMDDDALRRGQPTCHVHFDEATAILAGDALQALAFELLATVETHPTSRVRCELVRLLASAAGAAGMVGGQMMDLLAEDMTMDIGAITRLQRMKTGALIAFACESGAVLGEARDTERHALHAYAHDLGLAFQIQDDLLDIEGDAATTGKAVRKDETAGKATFVSILGAERARKQAKILADQAVAHLDIFGKKAELLALAAHFVVTRRH